MLNGQEMGEMVLGHLHGVPVRAGAGLRGRHVGGAIILEAEAVQMVAASARVLPFTVSKGGEQEDGFYTVRVKPGTVNDIEPATVDGYDGLDWTFALEIGDTLKIYLRATIDAGDCTVVAADLLATTGAVPANVAGDPDTGTPPMFAYRTVAEITRPSSAPEITNYLAGSQWVSVIVSNWSCTSIVRNVNWV